MNTIPTTFKDTPAYTVIGGSERRNLTGVSAVVLNRGAPHPRAVLFEELQKQGFDYVISMEGSRRRYDLDGLSASFPFVRFILSSENLSPGEEINIAALELPGPVFLVIWDDLRILRGSAEMIASRFLYNEEKKQRLCTVPLIQDGSLETLPTLLAPMAIKSKVKTLPFIPEEGQYSLFPFDGIGLYNKEIFLRLGGFDKNYSNFYWQLMDFGFRSWLWGEEIIASAAIKLSYEGPVTPEDTTAMDSFGRFYLKNLAPVFRGDHANLPLRRFPGFLWRLRGDLLTAWDEFSMARSWVKINQYRFRCDARTVMEFWNEIHDEEAES